MIISSYYILLTTGPVYIFLLLRHHIKKETEQLTSFVALFHTTLRLQHALRGGTSHVARGPV